MEENYPGIKLSRLLDEFSYFLIISKTPQLFFEKLKQGVPLEYITKHKFFYNTDFYIDERVLIPRFDSESMVYDIVEEIKKLPSNSSLCEVGVGSGCLGLALLKELEVTPDLFLATDVSCEALEVFDINMKRNKEYFSKTMIKTHLGDRLKDINEKFDIIFSNPPYIANQDMKLVHKNVHKHEPHLALYLNDESYLNWFEVFFKQAYDRLKVNGIFFMEGHEKKLEELNHLALKKFKSSEIKKDLQGFKRYLKIIK